jgi:hypothetical protein
MFGGLTDILVPIWLSIKIERGKCLAVEELPSNPEPNEQLPYVIR